ncbi:MAG: c-type cytochrome [Rhodospirillaceae bacterium]
MRFLTLIGALAVAGAIAAGIYFLGGFYSISAMQKDPAIVAAALGRVREASISRHGNDTPPVLDDPAVVQAGAREFLEHGCVNCHGGPGVKWAKFSEGLNPSPPDLKDSVGDLQPGEIFWVIKNGIKMTGMPSFGLIEVPDQDIWKIVAFLKKLPGVSEEDFRIWTAPAQETPAAEAPKH